MRAPCSFRLASLHLWAGLVALLTVVTWVRRAPFPLLYDDAEYLGSACAMVSLRSLEWGPAYATLLCALRSSPDLFVAFWTKQACVLLVGGLLFFALGLRYGLGTRLSALSGLWFVVGSLSPNGTLEFAFVFALLACISAACDSRRGWLGFFLLMGFAFLVRTEYVAGVAAAVALLAWRRLRHGEQRRLALSLGALVLASCLALGWASVPHSANGRAWFAFGQQFSANYQEAHAAPGDALLEWRSIVSQVFPTSHSIPAAARENPSAFAWHLRYNILARAPRALARLVLPVSAVPAWPPSWFAALAVASLALVLFAAWRGVSTGAGPRGRCRLLPLLSIAVIPGVSLLVRPQARHLLPLLPLLAVLASRGLSSRESAAARRWRLVLAFALTALLGVGVVAPWTVWLRSAPPSPSLEDRLRELTRVSAQRPVRVVASWYGERICALVGPRCESSSVLLRADGSVADAVFVDAGSEARADLEQQRELRASWERLGCVVDPEVGGIRIVRCPRRSEPPLGQPHRSAQPR